MRLRSMPTDETSSENDTPQRLGRYQIIRRIGVGGMAEIYLASLKQLEGCEKLVVIKRMLPKFVSDVEYANMFLNEARVVARLSHPNIVSFLEIESRNNEFFIAMEFLHGFDVLHILKRAFEKNYYLSLDAAISIILGLCAGLHYAHEKTDLNGRPLHIIHRDISPQNVFVTFDGGVKLLDFGIAKVDDCASTTRRGTVIGKISYMSPEQGRGELLDRRSDLFSLCILLWELTTRAKLLGGKNDYQILTALLEGELLRPSQVVHDYPPELEQIVMKGLRRDPSERYQTAEQLQVDLERFASERKLVISPRSVTSMMTELFYEERALHVVLPGGRSESGGAVPWLADSDAVVEDPTAYQNHLQTISHFSDRQITLRARRRLLITRGLIGIAASILFGWIINNAASRIQEKKRAPLLITKITHAVVKRSLAATAVTARPHVAPPPRSRSEESAADRSSPPPVLPTRRPAALRLSARRFKALARVEARSFSPDDEPLPSEAHEPNER